MKGLRKMKLYLASFLQPWNFGPGKIIGICSGKRPNHLDVDFQFKPFIPTKEILNQYYETKSVDAEKAGKEFGQAYLAQLEACKSELEEEAKKLGKTIPDLLEFQDGDTLASWERAEFSNYRRTLGEVLEKMGYEVEIN